MSIETTDLRVAVEESDGCRRRLSVTVPAGAVRDERRRAARELAGRMKMKGFREGKIPPEVVERRYGETLDREVLDTVIGEAYRQALRLEELTPISQGQVEEVKYERDQDLTFEVAFDVRPEVGVERLGGFVVERPRAEAGEEEMEKVLERLREQNAVFRPEEEGRPAPGDEVSVRIDPVEEGEPKGEARTYEIVLGKEEAIPEVEDAIRTLEPGESGTFTIAFPEDFPDEERRGQERTLHISLDARKVRELPELDDSLARQVGDFEDLEELKEAVRGDLTREAEQQAEAAVRSRLTGFLLEANPFDVPQSMVDSYLDQLLGDTEGADPERLEEARHELRPQAERAVKRILLVERIAESQGLEASEEEVDTRIEKIAEQNDARPEEVYARLQKAGRLEALEREITEEKVFAFLKERSEIVDAEG